jgi:predicted acylesterase/phospholipase RssA
MVEEWSRWRSDDVLKVDWRGILRGALWWAPSLMSNEPEKAVITRYIDEERLLPGVRLRIGLANLDTGEQDFFEWPGAEMRLADAVCAAVAVPVAVPPARVLGVQWADGLTVDGFPLEAILLATGVDRAFVVGVAPRQLAAGRYRNPYKVLLRAADLNQFSEPRLGLDRAEAGNRRLQRWAALRQEARQIVTDGVADEAGRARLLDELERIFDGAGSPLRRQPVEIVPILPANETRMQFGDFRPERSRAFLEQGRQDARRAVAALR